MNIAVALVDIYLRINGYFTVTEFPVVEAKAAGSFCSATDLDVLAFRFPGAGRMVGKHRGANSTVTCEVDKALGATHDKADMIVAEVKEGRAHLNDAMRDPSILEAALLRFGCCGAEHIPHVVRELLQHGKADTHCGHKVRMVAFGSSEDSNGPRPYHFVSTGHVTRFLQEFVDGNWELVRQAQFTDPAFAFLVMMEKAKRGISAAAR